MAESLNILRRAAANLSYGLRRLVASAALSRDAGFWISLRIESTLDEVSPPTLPFRTEPSLIEVLQTLDSAARDEAVAGVFVEIAGTPADWSCVQSVHRALQRLREAGKPVVAWADRLDERGLLLVSAATRIWLPESGALALLGVRVETLHLRGLLGHLGVRPEVLRIGSHKAAAEILTRDSMSPEQREQLEALADSWFGALVDALAAGRGLAPQAVRARIDAGPYTAQAALAAGLIDALVYPDEVEQRLLALAPLPPASREGPRRAPLVDARSYHALCCDPLGWRPLLSAPPGIAYVVARGGIRRGHGQRGIASETLGGVLGRLSQDASVRGVVLRIDSPGGDALASDLLWRAISKLRREKPVVASLGAVAASGGYYLASAADRVLAETGCVTGSIGVVGGKLDLSGLYQRIGVARDSVERGARAGLASEARGFHPDERRALREGMSAIYATFVDRVARGRGLSTEMVERVAQGRVFSGADAVSVGLVDAIGGPLEALAEARRLAGLAREPVQLRLHPRRARLPTLAALLRGAH